MRFFSSLKESLLKLLTPGSVFAGIVAVSVIINILTEIGTFYAVTAFVIPYVAIPVLSVSAFSFLFKRNKSDTFFSLPVKRTALYFSRLLAILIWTLVLYLPLIVMSIIQHRQAEYYHNDSFDICWRFFAVGIYNMSIITLGSTLTGRKFSALINALIVGFVPLSLYDTVLSVIYGKLDFLVPGAPGMPKMISGGAYSVLLGGEQIPLYLVLTVVCLLLGWLMFVKRKTETAEKSAPTKLLRIIHGGIICFSIGLLGYNLSSVSESLTVFIYGMAILVPLLYEFICTKRFSSIKYGLLSVGMGILVYVIMISFCSVASTVIRNMKIEIVGYKIVNNYSDYSEQTFRNNYSYNWGEWPGDYLNSYGLIATEEFFVTYPEEVELVRQRYREAVSFDTPHVDGNVTRMVLLDKNGKKYYRRAIFTEDEIERLTTDVLMKDKEYLHMLATLPEPETVATVETDDDVELDMELYRIFYKEMMALSDRQRISCTYSVDRNCTIPLKENDGMLNKDIDVRGTDEGYRYYARYRLVKEYHPQTYELLNEIFKDRSVEEALEVLNVTRDTAPRVTATLWCFPDKEDYPDKTYLGAEYISVDLHNPYSFTVVNRNASNVWEEGRLPLHVERYSGSMELPEAFAKTLKELIKNNVTDAPFPKGHIKVEYRDKNYVEREAVIPIDLEYSRFMEIAEPFCRVIKKW